MFSPQKVLLADKILYRFNALTQIQPYMTQIEPDCFEPYVSKCSRQSFMFYPQKVLLADKILYRFKAPPADDPFRSYGQIEPYLTKLGA